MDNQEIAAALSEIAVLMELTGENSFRTNAYHNASRNISQLTEEVAALVARNALGEVPGIGTTLQEKITTLVKTGSHPFLEELRGKVPVGLRQMLNIQGLGPKKVKALHDNLGLETIAALEAACKEGKVAELKGFGAKTQQKILEGIAFLSTVSGRVRMDEAAAVADTLLGLLKHLKEVQKIEVCGSFRRGRDTIKDIDILVASKNPKPVMDAFVTAPGVIQVLGHGDTKSSILIKAHGAGGNVSMQADLRVIEEKQFPFALMYFTGSKEHNVALRSRANDRGLKLNEYALAGESRDVPCKSEADVYKALGLEYIPPELRENTGEIAAAENNQLPKLVEENEIQGVFHNHTTYSDGIHTLEEMAHHAKKLGLKYLGIGDHSQSLTVANGLSPERVRKQIQEMDALNEKLRGIHLFKGIECDILADGSLDFDDETLGLFDYVVASVHTHFQMQREEMTARIIRAMRHPAVTMLGHLTGRLILRRAPYAVDQEAILQEAVKTGTLVEINAHPMRLDIDWVHCKRAKELGVRVVINPDAHCMEELECYRYGVKVARRGWLESADVFNTLGFKGVQKHFEGRKAKFLKG